MLYRIFSQVLSMSLTGSIVVLFVLLARWVLKKSPRIFSYGLWAIVLFRLLCPVAPVSELSLLNLLSDPIYSLQSQKDQAFQSHPEYIVDHDMMYQDSPIRAEYLYWNEGEVRKDLTSPWAMFMAITAKEGDMAPAELSHSYLPFFLILIC